MKEPLTLFGRRLRSLRKQVGVSQKQLGLMIGLDDGVASARMNQYEVGSHFPKFSVASDIAKVLNVPTAYFYAEEDDLAGFLAKLNDFPDDIRRDTLVIKSSMS